jgi:hypothetical protein
MCVIELSYVVCWIGYITDGSIDEIETLFDEGEND